MRPMEVVWMGIPPANEGPSTCPGDTGPQEGLASSRWGSKITSDLLKGLSVWAWEDSAPAFRKPLSLLSHPW